jgi:gamma-glutamyltranspeptidase / glutathione hydrolase
MLSLLQLASAVSLGSLLLQNGAANPVPEFKEWHPSHSGSGDGKYGDGKTGAVASESDICSTIGIELLKAGGNAADAVSLSLYL